MKFIAIDSGKFATKAAAKKEGGSTRELTFRTKCDQTQRTEAQGNTFLVELEGNRYLVGEQAESGSAKSTKAEFLHRISAYTAISRLAESGEDLIVAVGCPLSIYENGAGRAAYRDYMFPGREFDITVNRTTKHLKVRKVTVYPESSGVIHLGGEAYAQRMVGVVDIGGLNVNCCVYDKGIPVISSLFTDDLGSNVLTQGLRNLLSATYGEDIPDYLMGDILRQGYLRDNMSRDGKMEGSEKLIADYKAAHIDKIIRKCQENGWNLRIMDLIFTGGTSEMLRKDIQERLPSAAIFEDAAMSNVRGFLKAVSG